MDENIKPARAISPRSLAWLFDGEAGVAGIWKEEELRAIMEHQLAAEIGPDAERLSANFGRRARSIADHPSMTFGEALLESKGSLEILKLVKDFAKIHWHSPQSGVPKEIAAALYYAAIAAALHCYSAPISRISNLALRQGMDWVLEQEWIPDSIKSVCKAARDGFQDRETTSHDQ